MKALKLAILITCMFLVYISPVLAEDVQKFFSEIAWDNFEGDQPIPVEHYDRLATLDDQYVAILGITGARQDERGNTRRFILSGLNNNDSVIVSTFFDYPTNGVHHIIYGQVTSDDGVIVIREAGRDRLVEGVDGFEIREVYPPPGRSSAPASTNEVSSTETGDNTDKGDTSEINVETVEDDDLLGWVRSNPLQAAVILIAALALIGGLILMMKPSQSEQYATGDYPTAVSSPPSGQSISPSPSVSDTAQTLDAVPITTRGSVTVVAWGNLKVISGPNTGQIYPLSGSVITIGRDDKCDITLSDNTRTVSSTHARIQDLGLGRLAFIDESTNGSKVNGKKVHKAQVDLPLDAKISVGPYELQVSTDHSSATRSDTVAYGASSASAASSTATKQFMGVELVVTSDGKDKGKRFPIGSYIVKIGRGSDQDLQLQDEWVSGAHALLKLIDGKWQIENISRSKQGTTVNGNRVEGIVTVHSGDKIAFGPTEMEFRSVG